jgi:hypothetical protein
MPQKRPPKKTVSRSDVERHRNNRVPFFVPATSTDELRDQTYVSICKFVETSVDGPRIRALWYTHDGDEYFDEVGEITSGPREPVIAILERGDHWVICTPTRGVVRGGPIMVGIDSVVEIHFFDGTSKDGDQLRRERQKLRVQGVSRLGRFGSSSPSRNASHDSIRVSGKVKGPGCETRAF